jgi:hypothetical protein
VSETEREFEQFVADLEAQIEASKITGGIGERERAQLDALIADYRSQIRAAEDETAAREIFARFQEQSARFGQGGGLP